MYRFSTYKRQYKANLKLALPVVMTQLGQILVQVADNVMVGRYGGDDPTPLAATSFGGSVFFILFIAGVGIALGLTPLIGELYAQGDRCKSSQYLQNGLMFYTLLGFLVCGLQLAVIPLMYHMGQPVEVVDMAIPYYKLLAYSMPFIMLFFTFKQFLEGVGNTRVEMVVVILCNLMNVGLNWIFIYGHLGFEELGATGAGLGTLGSRIAMPIMIIGYFYKKQKYRAYLQGFSPRNYSVKTIRTLLRMGLPISLQMFLEASAFVGTSIMMGWLSKTAISANQIAMTLGNCAFMIVTSIGAATTIRISHCYGARSLKELTLAAKASYRLEPLRRHHVHLALQRHPDFLHHQRRSDRPGLEADPADRRLPVGGRHPERFGRHSAGYSGREDHHADRFPLVHRLQPAGGLPVGLYIGNGRTGADSGLHRRSYDGRRTADRPLPPRYPALEGRHPIIRDLRFPAATHIRPAGICRSLSRINLALLPDFTIFTEIYDSNG